MTPIDHTSAVELYYYDAYTSGELYNCVPKGLDTIRNLDVDISINLAQPKSHTLYSLY
jgi:hypothetical protein